MLDVAAHALLVGASAVIASTHPLSSQSVIIELVCLVFLLILKWLTTLDAE